MPARLIPLFPLRAVVFPGTRRPLHIAGFIPRQRAVECVRAAAPTGGSGGKRTGL